MGFENTCCYMYDDYISFLDVSSSCLLIGLQIIQHWECYIVPCVLQCEPRLADLLNRRCSIGYLTIDTVYDITFCTHLATLVQ